MRTQKELQQWLRTNQINKDDVLSVWNWLDTSEEYDIANLSFKDDCGNGSGKTIQDVIDFVNSTSPQTDLNPLVAQFEKVEKEIAKLRKIINKL